VSNSRPTPPVEEPADPVQDARRDAVVRTSVGLVAAAVGVHLVQVGLGGLLSLSLISPFALAFGVGATVVAAGLLVQGVVAAVRVGMTKGRIRPQRRGEGGERGQRGQRADD
jgi:hypothetical protein